MSQDSTISGLTSVGSLNTTDTFPLDQGTTTKKSPISQLLSSSLFTQTGTGAIARSINGKFGDIVSVKDFGAKGDGVTDDAASANAALASGAKVVVVPYTSAGYKIGSTVSFVSNDQELRFDNGAFFTFTGTGACIEIGTSGTLQRCIVTNATINGAAGQTGIRIFRSLRCRLSRCRVVISATGIGYDFDGNAVQNFYNYVEDCEVDNTNHSAPYTGTGIHLRNEANQNTIIRATIQYVDTCIQMAKTGGTSASGNLVQSSLMQNFQTYGVNFPASATATGNSLINNWFENTPTVGTGVNISDTTTVATFLLGNVYTGLTANLNDLSDNTGTRQTMQLDLDRQRIGNLLLEFQTATGGLIRAQRWARASPSDQNLDLIGNGFNIYGAQDLTHAGIHGDGSGNIQMKTKGLSATNTPANNLRGSATFVSAATVAVTFGTAETSNAYFVALSSSANETFWVTAKLTTGFTLNSSNAASVAVVDWILVR